MPAGGTIIGSREYERAIYILRSSHPSLRDIGVYVLYDLSLETTWHRYLNYS